MPWVRGDANERDAIQVVGMIKEGDTGSVRNAVRTVFIYHNLESVNLCVCVISVDKNCCASG